MFHFSFIYYYLQSLPTSIVDVINKCLQLKPSDRPTPAELLKHPVFLEYTMDNIEILPIAR